MGFYESKRKTADNLLKRYGRAMTLRDNTVSETFDPATGVVTQGGPDYVDYPCLGITYPVAKGKRSGGNESVFTQKVILSAEGLGLVPTVSHQLVIGGRVYEISNVSPVEPGGVAVLYELSVVL